MLLAIATGVTAEGEADEGIFVVEAENVELRASKGGPSLGQEFESGVAVGISAGVAETVELAPSAKRLESKLAACSGESVSVTDGSVVVIIDGSGEVINGISVTVSVTTDWLEATAGGVAVGGEVKIVVVTVR